jgi:FAD dependent oxidoreductase TIGR03364
MKKYDLLVIGGGVLGTFHAYHAAILGYRVALIERDTQPMGASVRNFGQLVPSGMNLKWQRYGRKSLETYCSLQKTFDITVRKNGTIYIASNDEEMTLVEELAAINKANDYTSELWTSAQCIQRYEGLRADYCKGGLFFPDEITVEPRTAVARIQQYLLVRQLLDYYPHTLVTQLESNDHACTARSANGRSFVAEKALVCNGHEFQVLFPQIFAQSDLQWVKLQMVQTHPQPTQSLPGSVLTGLSIRRYESFSECPSYAAIKAKEDPHSLDKKWGVHILFKQAVDGSVIIGDTHEYLDVADGQRHGFPQQEAMNHYMMAEAAKIIDLQNTQVAETWTGTYAQCKHSDIFKHTIDGRIHLLTGIGGKGMTASAGFAASNVLDYLR